MSVTVWSLERRVHKYWNGWRQCATPAVVTWVSQVTDSGVARVVCSRAVWQLAADHGIRWASVPLRNGSVANVDAAVVAAADMFALLRGASEVRSRYRGAWRWNIKNQWLKCHRAQGNAVPSPTETGSRRSPTSSFQRTQRNGRRNAVETESALTVCTVIVPGCDIFLHFERQSEWQSQIQTGVLWGYVTTKTIGDGPMTTAGLTTRKSGPTPTLQFPRLEFFHFKHWLEMYLGSVAELEMKLTRNVRITYEQNTRAEKNEWTNKTKSSSATSLTHSLN